MLLRVKIGRADKNWRALGSNCDQPIVKSIKSVNELKPISRLVKDLRDQRVNKLACELYFRWKGTWVRRRTSGSYPRRNQSINSRAESRREVALRGEIGLGVEGLIVKPKAMGSLIAETSEWDS